jgi:hypothetical protein
MPCPTGEFSIRIPAFAHASSPTLAIVLPAGDRLHGLCTPDYGREHRPWSLVCREPGRPHAGAVGNGQRLDSVTDQESELAIYFPFKKGLWKNNLICSRGYFR